MLSMTLPTAAQANRKHPGNRGRFKTTKRSALAGWAQYGYCASHSRNFWGLRLHLVCTLHGLPVTFALTGARPTSARYCWTVTGRLRRLTLESII
jgi:hypothetical protein